MKQHKLTADDQLLFDNSMKKWAVLLNLGNWRIERAPGFAKGALADVLIHPEDRLAVYRVGKTFGSTTPVTPYSLEQTAVHELLHVFLRDYHDAVKSGSDEFIMAAEHSIITVLENLLLKETK